MRLKPMEGEEEVRGMRGGKVAPSKIPDHHLSSFKLLSNFGGPRLSPLDKKIFHPVDHWSGRKRGGPGYYPSGG